MLPIVLAALAALTAGTADFSGGKASQREHPLAVTVLSQLLGLPVIAVCLAAVPGHAGPAALAWSVAAGLAGFGGIVLLYRALSSGAMAVVAPITAVTAAIIPICAGLLTSRTPGTLALGGAGLAVLAIALVSLGPGGRGRRMSARLVGLALAAGALFGLFFALFAQPGAGAGMWPLLAARVASVILGLAVLRRAGLALRLTPAAVPWAVIAGVLDIAGNAFYLLAAGRGHLSIVAAITALYPVSTVLLALAVDRERLRPVQIAGLGLAATALVLAAG